jgi:hypothetical protein
MREEFSRIRAAQSYNSHHKSAQENSSEYIFFDIKIRKLRRSEKNQVANDDAERRSN